MAWEVWATFRQLGGSGAWEARQRGQRSRFFLLNITCWGLPALVTATTLTIHFLPPTSTQDLTRSGLDLIRPGLGDESCFFHGSAALLLYFHGIIFLILLVNLCLFLTSAYALLFGIWATSREDGSSRQGIRQMFWIVLELFLVMGLTWLADVVSLLINWLQGGIYAGYEILFFDIINSLQGLLIFLVLICKPRMRKIIRSSLGPVCSTAFSCFRKKAETVHSPIEFKKGPFVSPTTKTSVVSLPSPSRLTESPGSSLGLQSPSHRTLSVRDSFTPTWKRGSYNFGYTNSMGDDGAVQTLSLHDSSLNESRC